MYFKVNSSFLGLSKFFLVSFGFTIEFDSFLFHVDLIVDFDVIDDGLILSGKFVGSGDFLIIDFFGELLFGFLELFIERFDLEFIFSLYGIEGLFSRLFFEGKLIIVTFLYGCKFDLIFLDDILDFNLVLFLDCFVS